MDTPGTSETPQIAARQALEMLRSGAVLLDVRELDEWDAGHAPEAVHIPLGQLAAQIGRLDRSQPVIIICRSGRRSDEATMALRDAGYDAYNFSGGMYAWQEAGGTVRTPSGSPGNII